MNINSSSPYNINSSYTIKLNEKEALVFEEKELKKVDNPHLQKLKEDEEKKANESSKTNPNKLSPDEERLVLDLQSRDSEVKAHEAAHQSGGASTGAATYTYQQGPDGKMYAIGGEVSVSFKTGSTPQETVANAQAVIASATAPANPSGQDMAVASSAMVMMMKAKQQISQEAQEKISGQETYKKDSIEPFEISA
ncbi:putative metalloprotease CJM1_0395 family protein [Sulfurimonas sp.]|uniref:putative metalloprotease CJM1_0395 family protein n=1 Tax=Sulfurimonas sp. TaxID=2022749 RepID=UPI002AAF79BD|nr:putative metalloprotease CJM1_0395 family protein [Sulfurimonas sp.]